MSESKHTPGVYKWCSNRDDGGGDGAIFVTRRSGEAVAVAVQPRYTPDQQWSEDAAHIVRAVNAHDDLLAAAKKAIPELRCLYEQVAKRSIETATNGSVRRAVDALAAAIAKAEGANP